jgi:ABC-2 type transport system permease protein
MIASQEMSSKAMQMFDDNEVLDITSLLYDQNNLSKIVIDEEAVCVVIIPKGFEKMVLTKRYRKL